MKANKTYSIVISLIVALGGFLLGFDSAVISGATPFYKVYFDLPSGSFLIGFSVGSIIFGAMVGNFFAGSLADKFGRKKILILTAFLFSLCALGTAFSTSISIFIAARIIGGIGVGMAILIAPMYIAEIAPKKLRGTLVTFNQLNIVLGISIAYFSNYFILQTVTNPETNWRWMLGVGVVPAFLYFIFLFFVPGSPRWLIQKGRDEEGKKILQKINGDVEAEVVYNEIKGNLNKSQDQEVGRWSDLFTRKMKTVLIIGLGIAFFQQITGINAIFYYAPMIFEMTGGGKDAAFMQAALLGVTNVIMTVVSMVLIDKLGRKPLLIIGSIGITLSLALAGFAFNNAKYKITSESIENIVEDINNTDVSSALTLKLSSLTDKEYNSETAFFADIKQNITAAEYNSYKEVILKSSITINTMLVLIGLILYVASFAISLGPVMWALLSEIFPNKLRGIAISVVGFWNSVVSFSVASIFPTELEAFGSATTFFIYAIFGMLTLLFVLKFVKETKGKSLEEIEETMIRMH